MAAIAAVQSDPSLRASSALTRSNNRPNEKAKITDWTTQNAVTEARAIQAAAFKTRPQEEAREGDVAT